MRLRSTVLMKTASPHAPFGLALFFRPSPALLFVQLLGCATSLALKVVIVPLARGMALELSVAETLLTTGMQALPPPRSPTHPSPLLQPASLCAFISSLVRALFVALLACGTLLEMAAETVGGTLGARVPATAAVLPCRLLCAAHAAPLPLTR